MKRITVLCMLVFIFWVPSLFCQNQPVQKQIKPYEVKAVQFDSVLAGRQAQKETELLKTELKQLKAEVEQLRSLTNQLMSRLNENQVQGQQLEELPDRSQYKSLTIPACAFVPQTSRTDFAFVTREENQFMGALNNLMRSGESEFLAPVMLPQGVHVRSVEMGFCDAQNATTFSPHVELRLIRRKLQRGVPGWFEMAVLYSKEIESYWDVVRTDDIKNPSIKNSHYGYFLKVKIKGRAQLTLVKISYED